MKTNATNRATSVPQPVIAVRLIFFFCVSFPSIVGEWIGVEFGGDFGRWLGLIIGCIVAALIFCVVVHWNPNRDLIQSMGVALGIPVGTLLGELSFKSNESWNMFVVNCGMALLGICIILWVFASTAFAEQPVSTIEPTGGEK